MENNTQYKINPWSPVPPPALNGGLYTGQPFAKDAPWGNIPVRPTSAYMINQNLRSSSIAPIGALFQMTAGYRAGNNSCDLMPGVTRFTGDENFGPFRDILCLPCFQKVAELKKTNCKEVIIPII
jgi:hypothetical protein